MLPRQNVQELLSLAYIRAVSALAGCICHTPPDFGVDLWVGYLSMRDGERRDLGHHLGIQAKATTRAIVAEDHIAYDLDVKAYRDLRSSAGLPRILVLYVMPEAEQEWLDLSEDHLSLRRCAYWQYLGGSAATENGASIRIAIPRANRFDVDALRGPLRRLATTRRWS